MALSILTATTRQDLASGLIPRPVSGEWINGGVGVGVGSGVGGGVVGSGGGVAVGAWVCAGGGRVGRGAATVATGPAGVGAGGGDCAADVPAAATG